MAKQTFTTGQVLTAAQMTSLQQTAMLGGAASAKTASYTLVAADAGTAISMSSASATTITVNTALFAAGDTVHITNLGAGVCTITAGTATVNSSASLALAQYESGFLDFTSTSAAIFVKGAGASASTGSDPFLTPEVSGYYVKRLQSGSASGGETLVEDRTYYLPVFLPTATYDRISIRSGDYAATATVRLGLYNASATTGLPTTVVFDAGTVAPTAINTNYEITISQSITAGYYYMAFNLQAFTGDGNYFTGGVMATPPLPFLLTATSFGVGLGITHFTENSVTGAFATAGSLVAQTGSSCPIIGMRIA